MKQEKINRRNLSGIHIFHKFEDDKKRQPTCIEDCPEEKQKEWLETLDNEAVIRTAMHLCNIIKTIGNQFDLMSGSNEEE